MFISDNFNFEEDTQLIIDLTEYIFDVDNNDLDITISNNYHTSWSIEGMQLTLSAEENWNGMENLTLTASDGEASDSDNFIVIVTPVNDPPAIDLPPEVNFAEDGQLIINLNNYCSDPDGDPLNYSCQDSPNLSTSITGSYIIINAEENWNGWEYLLITVTDDSQVDAIDSLLVIVSPVNDAPVIELPDSFSFDEDSQINIDFSQYVDDIDGNDLSLLVSGNSYINVQITGLDVALDAPENWWGEEQLQFTVNDGQIRATASDQVQIIVNPVNDPPEMDLPDQLSFYSYSQITEDFSEYIIDPENDEISLAADGNENIVVEITNLNVTFSADPGWTGSENIIFTASDGELSAESIISVEVLEPSEIPDLILPETISFAEDTVLIRDFSAYIFNTGSFDLELTSMGNDQIMIGINGLEVTFSAAADWNGMEEISFMISDTVAGFEASDSVIVNVNPVNDPPQIDLPAEISFLEDSSTSFDCAEYITDIDNSEFIISVTGNQMILVGIEGLVLDFESITNYYGTEQLTVTVNDNSGRALDSDTLNVIVESVNDIPVLNLPDEIIFNEDEIYGFSVFDYISDADEDSLQVSFSSNFNCEFNQVEEIVNIIPPADYFGDGIITVEVSDGIETLSDQIEVTIYPVNDAPVLDLPDSFNFLEDELFTFDISDYASDVDGDNLLISNTGPFYIFVVITGTIVELEPLSNWNGSAEITFTVSDGLLSDSDDVDIVVEAVNDMPSLSGFLPQETELLYYGETTLEFYVNVYDNDSDLNYIWYVNDIDQGINADNMEYNFTQNGEYIVSVEISDEEYQLNQQWLVTIYSGPGWNVIVYTNSTVIYSQVTIDNAPAGENDLVGAFVDEECRGIGEIVIDGNNSYSSFLIQGEAVETVNFKIYSADSEAIYDVIYTAQTNPGGDLGYPPDNLIPIAAYSVPGPGWLPVDIYEDCTTVYATVTIDGQAASEEDVVGAFDTSGECLGVGTIEFDDDIAFCEIEVFQDTAVEFNFKVWDASVNAIFEDYSVYNTDPQGQIGEPGNEIEIAVISSAGPGWEAVVYTNSTTGYFVITINNEPAEAEEDLLGIFVDGECRGVGNITNYEGETISTVEIQGEDVESCNFRIWDNSAQAVYYTDFEISTDPGGNIGYPPDEIELSFWSYILPEYQEFPRPWNVVYYTNSTVAYGSLTIDDQPVSAGNEIAAFAGNECRGVAQIVITDEESIFTMNIQGDGPEAVQFNYYDISEDQIYSVEYFTITNPGGDIGYPPNLLPLAIYTNFAPEVNLPPGFSFDEDEVVSEDMSSYIIDPDGDELTLGFSGNIHINIEIDGMMVTAYGEENWNGTEIVDYSVDDGNGHIVTGTLELEVIPVNDAPDVNLPYSFTLQEDSDLTVDFSLFISDIEGDAWTLACETAENIEVEIEGSMVTLIPALNWNGQEILTFNASDGMDTGSDTLLIIVNPQPDAPIVDFPDQIEIYENAYITFNIAEHISDPDGDELTIYAEGNTNISVDVTTDSITFTPTPDWSGFEIVTILADDEAIRLIGFDEIGFNVIHVHIPPELFLPEQFDILEDSPDTFDLNPYFLIYEGEEFAFSVTGNDSIIIAFEGADMTIDAPLNWNGMETIVITLDDEPGRLTVSDTVNIMVEAVNDPPEIVEWLPEELELEVVIDTTITFSVVVEDVDSDVGYTWYVNEIEQPANEAEFTVTFAETGEYEIQCMAYDEEEERYQTWNITVIHVDNDPSGLQAVTALTGNYPNPFNPATTIKYCVQPEDLPAVLKVFNLKGQSLRTWKIEQSGLRQITWNGCDGSGKMQASGVYIYQLQSGAGIDSKRMLLLK
ncbi:MAG: tandem-95 repeat protein [Candidatus Stygibacter australis]|nr:tandem-95 repeat protein [Candidatus Stygibacter australis]